MYRTMASGTELESCLLLYYRSPADLSHGLTTACVTFQYISHVYLYQLRLVFFQESFFGA